MADLASFKFAAIALAKVKSEPPVTASPAAITSSQANPPASARYFAASSIGSSPTSLLSTRSASAAIAVASPESAITRATALGLKSE